ncbi:MAG: hypothetical protein IIX28_04945 [Clostridia bacterium]|nr:hypothetical protein [Clostridia bacterium]
MDDLNEKLERLLSDPEGIAKIQAAMSALGGGEATAPAPPPPSAMPDMTALTKLMPLISNLGAESDDTRLLGALRPYLHGQRVERLDESMRLLQLIKLIPLLQQQGVLTGGNTHGG